MSSTKQLFIEEKKGRDLYNAFIQITWDLFDTSGEELKTRQELQQRLSEYLQFTIKTIRDGLKFGIVNNDLKTIEIKRLCFIRKFYDFVIAVYSTRDKNEVPKLMMDALRLFRELDYDLYVWEGRCISIIY